MIFIIYLLGLIAFIPLDGMQETIKISCSDGKMDMPINIVGESEILSLMINDLGGPDTITNKDGIISIQWQNIPADIAIPIPYPRLIINDLCTVLKNFNTNKTLGTQNISKYQLQELITLTGAFHHLNFTAHKNLTNQWNKKIDSEIYQQCKDMSWDQLEQQVIPLYPNPLHRDLTRIIFCKPIINKIKFELMKRALTNNLGLHLHGDKRQDIVFSPDNKICVTIGYSKKRDQSLITMIDLVQNLVPCVDFPIEKTLPGCIKLSSDSKKIICGRENNILIYNIEGKGTINPTPFQSVILTPTDTKKQMQLSLSQDGKLIAFYNGKDLVLWHFDENGMINEKFSQILMTTEGNNHIVSSIQFNDDGTIYVIARNEESKLILYIFNIDGTINTKVNIDANIMTASFYKHDKRFAAITYDEDSRFSGKASLYVYDFNDINNISKEFIYSDHFDSDIAPCILFDDTAIIARLSKYQSPSQLAIIDINGNVNSTEISFNNHTMLSFYVSPDNQKIAFLNESLQNRFGKITKFANLYTLLALEEKNALEYINQLDIKPLLLLDRVLGKTENISTLAQYDIAPQIIDLLQKINPSNKEIINPATLGAITENPKVETEDLVKKVFAHQALQDKESNAPQTDFPKNEQKKAPAPQVLLEQKSEQPGNIPAAIPLQTKQPQEVSNEAQNKEQPQPQSENEVIKPATWKEFFANIDESVRSFVSGAINYYGQ